MTTPCLAGIPEPPPRYVDMLQPQASTPEQLSAILADKEMLEAYYRQLQMLLQACQ